MKKNNHSFVIKEEQLDKYSIVPLFYILVYDFLYYFCK